MPQATSTIVINNAAAVAKTFDLLSPAAGDGAACTYVHKVGAITKVFPKWLISSRASQDARKSLISFTYPSSYVDTASGLTIPGVAAQANIAVTMPDGFPEAMKDDFAAFVVNGAAQALIKACIRDALGAN